MKKRKVLYWIFLLMMFLPMSLVWCAYGEKGIYGTSLLDDPRFYGALLFQVFIPFLKGKVRRYWQIAANIWLFYCYIWLAQGFAEHLPGYVPLLQVVQLPFWISFIGAIGISLCNSFETKEATEEKQSEK